MEKILSIIISAVMMASSNAVCNVDRAPSDAIENPALVTEPAAEQTAAPAETAAPEEYPIEYDDTNERQAHYMRDFKITNLEVNESGDYVLTYTLRTFLEGRGTVTVSFNCLDADGSVVDTFGGGFVGTDYTWSYHESTAVISGRTAKIELVLNQ